jgi:hypothetical protein
MTILNQIQEDRFNYCLKPIFIKKIGTSKYIATRCNKCIRCKRHNIEVWDSRIINESNEHKEKLIVRLPINNQSIEMLKKEVKTSKTDLTKYIHNKDRHINNIATIAIKRFLQNLRKTNKTSIKHWLITELRNKQNNKLVIHGIMFTNKINEIRSKWKYGQANITKVNIDRLFKIINYINNPNQIQNEYKPVIFNSPGFNKKYTPKSNTSLTNFERLLIENRNKATALSIKEQIKEDIQTEININYENERADKMFLKRIKKSEEKQINLNEFIKHKITKVDIIKAS